MRCVDLFCGDGGWTDAFLLEGFRVIGFDLVRRKAYRGELVLQDIRTIDGTRLRGADVVVASPPCEGFSEARSDRLRPQPADLELVLHTCRVIREAAPRFWIIENVRGAVGWFEPMLGWPSLKNKPWYLWGTVPAVLLPRRDLQAKMAFRSAWLRARVPPELAQPIARAFAEALRDGPVYSRSTEYRFFGPAP